MSASKLFKMMATPDPGSGFRSGGRNRVGQGRGGSDALSVAPAARLPISVAGRRLVVATCASLDPTGRAMAPEIKIWGQGSRLLLCRIVAAAGETFRREASMA